MKKTVAIVLIACAGMSFLGVLAKSRDSSNETYHTEALVDAAQPAANIDVNADLDPETLGSFEQVDGYDICIDTTNADPNFDPLSAFDAEILDALRDADPETRIDYDPITGTVTIPDQDASSGAPILQTDGYDPSE